MRIPKLKDVSYLRGTVASSPAKANDRITCCPDHRRLARSWLGPCPWMAVARLDRHRHGPERRTGRRAAGDRSNIGWPAYDRAVGDDRRRGGQGTSGTAFGP